MTSGGFSAAYSLLIPHFQEETGISVITTRGASFGDSPTTIPSRLSRGEQADVVILAKESLDRLVEQGEIRSGSQTDLVRSTIGMAVRSGAVVPDISSIEKFIDSVLQSESFG
jgi:molybdate transport system substrate-binding protein